MSRYPMKRLYECGDCAARRMVSWVELNRSSKPRCHACGSTILDLVSEDAKRDRMRLNRERIEPSTTALVISKHCDDKRKRVV